MHQQELLTFRAILVLFALFFLHTGLFFVFSVFDMIGRLTLPWRFFNHISTPLKQFETFQNKPRIVFEGSFRFEELNRLSSITWSSHTF